MGFQLLLALVTWASAAAPESWLLIPTSSSSPEALCPSTVASCTPEPLERGWEGLLVPQVLASLFPSPSFSLFLFLCSHLCTSVSVPVHTDASCLQLPASVSLFLSASYARNQFWLCWSCLQCPLPLLFHLRLQEPLSSSPFVPRNRPLAGKQLSTSFDVKGACRAQPGAEGGGKGDGCRVDEGKRRDSKKCRGPRGG